MPLEDIAEVVASSFDKRFPPKNIFRQTMKSSDFNSIAGANLEAFAHGYSDGSGSVSHHMTPSSSGSALNGSFNHSSLHSPGHPGSHALHSPRYGVWCLYRLLRVFVDSHMLCVFAQFVHSCLLIAFPRIFDKYHSLTPHTPHTHFTHTSHNPQPQQPQQRAGNTCRAAQARPQRQLQGKTQRQRVDMHGTRSPVPARGVFREVGGQEGERANVEV